MKRWKRVQTTNKILGCLSAAPVTYPKTALERPSAYGPDLRNSRDFGCRVLGLQGFTGSTLKGLLGFSGFQGSKISGFQGF